MRLTLKDFQVDALDQLRRRSLRASADVIDEGPQSLVLAAPTGSGKTVLAGAWMEAVALGDEHEPADEDATFLWITDQPALNAQTRRKLETAMSLPAYRLVPIGASFHAEQFAPGTIYFLNTQKLSRTANLVRRGDHRTHTIWDTIANTIARRPRSFWVVVDEAHRGMGQSAHELQAAETIVQKFIFGSEGELPAVPLLLGISATPERFTRLAVGDRTLRAPVTVDAEAVRASGLLKDAITLYHPQENQPSDLTLLRAAAEQAQRYTDEWAEYSDREQAPSVSPILVVQVEDGTKTKLTRTDLAACIEVVEDVLGPLGLRGVAHAFQEEHAVDAGAGRKLRYLSPENIQDDPDVRVVFFKRSLTTGWDCPRAEVMMSFRHAVDETLIAQLVGRMVRTPLARSVSRSEFLNTVCLYLPHYDERALDAVIERLTKPDPGVALPVPIRRGEALVTLARNPATEEAFATAATLSTVRVEKGARRSPVRRLLSLGRLLAWDELESDALSDFYDALVAVLLDELNRVQDTPVFAERLDAAAGIDVRGVTVAVGSTEKLAVTSERLAAVAGNVEHAFAEAGRRLGGGLHRAYLTARATEPEAVSVTAAKLELYALVQDPDVLARVQQRAEALMTAAVNRHRAATNALPDERRHHYRRLRRQGTRPEPESLELPPAIEVTRGGAATYELHLYAGDDGTFTFSPNGWERATLDAALAEDGVIGWLRNEPRKPWSFTIPYESGSETKPMYPDFLVFRREGTNVLCDVLEPHAPGYDDNVAKAKGMAKLAQERGHEFGRIRMLVKVGGALRQLRLEDDATRDRVLVATTREQLAELYSG